MGTTVTMDLERFKELESKEIAFEKIVHDPSQFVLAVGWNGSWRCVPHNEAFEQIRADMEEMKRFAESWRKKAEGCI